MSQLAEITRNLVDSFKELKQDGWTIVEVIEFLYVCLRELVVFAGAIKEKSGEEKADWVAEQFKVLYWKINPDIPKIPNFVETLMEKVVIDYITPALVKLAYKKVFGKKIAMEKE